MNILLVITAFSSFVIYAAAIMRMFSRDHGVALPMRLIQFCGSAFALVHLWGLWETPQHLGLRSIIALLVYLTGLAVFFAACNALNGYRLTLAFSPDAPQSLVHRGIYNRVRHPFYLSYTLTWLAGVIAATTIPVIMTSVIMIGFYVAAARMEEQKFLASPLADQYRAYRRRAGLFWPLIQ